jgi:hypothetical protein
VRSPPGEGKAAVSFTTVTGTSISTGEPPAACSINLWEISGSFIEASCKCSEAVGIGPAKRFTASSTSSRIVLKPCTAYPPSAEKMSPM